MVKHLDVKENIHKWITQSLGDPIIKILAENSNLTKTQIETLLIDILGPNMSCKTLTMEEKSKLRIMKAGVSRGSFNRTLRQARQNVIQSVYTILLLGYLGFFDDARLTPYLEVANKLQSYLSAYRAAAERDGSMDEHMRIVKMLHEQLEDSLQRLSKPREL